MEILKEQKNFRVIARRIDIDRPFCNPIFNFSDSEMEKTAIISVANTAYVVGIELFWDSGTHRLVDPLEIYESDKLALIERAARRIREKIEDCGSVEFYATTFNYTPVR